VINTITIIIIIICTLAVINTSLPLPNLLFWFSGSGVPTPLEVRLLPQREGLGRSKIRDNGQDDSVDKSSGGKGRQKKTRGGERSRKKKHAARAREVREQEKDEEHQAELRDGTAGIGLFSFINGQLGRLMREGGREGGRKEGRVLLV
jgi:hypothetical protein